MSSQHNGAHAHRARATRTALAAALILAGAASAHAEAPYPSKPIRMVLPSGAGTVTDQTARLVAERLTAGLKQPVVVDNRPGANGIIANETVARAAPDGYTLLFTYAATMTVNPWTTPSLPYDPLKDFTPIARPSQPGGNLLAVSAGVPVHNLRELIAYAKSSKTELAYCSWGVGSGGHLAMEYLKAKAGIHLRHIPYKTATQCSNDLAAGHVTIGITDAISAVPHLKSGRIRGIAVSGPERLLTAPDVPTMSQQGVPFQQASWVAIFGPRGVPAPIVERLNAEVNRILQSPADRARFAALNLQPAAPSSPADLGKLVSADLAAWGEVVKVAGLQAK
ncbi:Tripartite-type tricarboxylate transporter, receptor component TctC (plasmid) [Cupriavidus taiwanensis]|uniref:Tripartite-type tricarboxylate transporter, receptor component TctC n=1 Tax=Cupriavidus taiwanensis TaxID=164546 RepID=A0A9Q7UZ34_9BURK|nr:tripartite tricarboxylate transporter substrate binding protein [Cupriavidus taiwanensis]SPD67260.1 Tripartite-type tricarboxylate transporter, receptor component TctC [Cupriavidus taiwanensis]